MKLLKDLLYKANLVEVSGTTNVAISGVVFDSRKMAKDSLFVAVRGQKTDGHLFISEVVSKGVVAVVCEEFPETMPAHVTFVKVRDASYALGVIASNFFDNPSSALKLVGVTGTNGKTTTTTLLFNLFRGLGFKCGLISTVKIQINNTAETSRYTTPDAFTLNEILSRMVQKGCTHAFMEVSSHAVSQNRIAGLRFAGGVFTNITHDHLDYHGTFDNYLAAKKKFFDGLSAESFALINKDDPNGKIMVQNTRATVKTFSLRAAADFKGKVMENQFSGLLVNFDGTEVWSKLIGGFNASNLLAVYGTAVLLGGDSLNVLTALSTLDSPEGRFQYVRSTSGITGIVDYAHTPDALENVLKTIQDIRPGNENVISVVGCGGDRDAAKRPLMASLAAKLSNKVILTSDNPRSEDPGKIIKEMEAGVEIHERKKVISIIDRREAIKTACSLAQPREIILVDGKGHETYQEINGERFPFDDLEILKEIFNQLDS